MNREIKFRVWDGKSIQYLKDEMFWLLGKSGYFELQDHRAEHFDTIESDNGHKDLSILNKTDNREAVLMQYTGSKNRSGKELYEGDIDESGAVIMWSKKLNLSCLHCYSTYYKEWFESSYPMDSNGIEVIGNIYENPELLTEPNTVKSGEDKSDTATAPKEN